MYDKFTQAIHKSLKRLIKGWWKLQKCMKRINSWHHYLVSDGFELMEADLFGLSGFPLFEFLTDAGNDVKAVLKGESNLKKTLNFRFP